MSIEDDVNVIANLCENIEDGINKELQIIMESQSKQMLANVLVNLGTSLLAKAIIMVQEEHRETIVKAISRGIAVKVAEGDAAIDAIIALEKAMQMRH